MMRNKKRKRVENSYYDVRCLILRMWFCGVRCPERIWILVCRGKLQEFLLGDGKTWNGLIGGSLTSGLLCIIMVMVTEGNTSNALPFVDPVFESQPAISR